jgi:hypothetical protein
VRGERLDGEGAGEHEGDPQQGDGQRLALGGLVSAEVERRRAADPYYLTSTMVGMGTLITEGDHLYLDRSADWRGALRLILAAARDEEDRAGAAAVVLRDLPDGDGDLHGFLLGEGFLRVPGNDSWVRELDFTDDGQFLAGLAKKARYHQRVKVVGWEGRYRVEVVPGASAAARRLGPAARDDLYALYRNVHARNLALNVFPLPRRLLDAVLGNPSWELILLSLADGPAQPVAFAAQYVGADQVQPVFVGLDYRYVASHHSYQQTLWQAVRSGQRHGARRVLLGIGADLQKARFGAKRERRWVFVQPTESYQAAVLNQLTERVAAAPRDPGAAPGAVGRPGGACPSWRGRRRGIGVPRHSQGGVGTYERQR